MSRPLTDLSPSKQNSRPGPSIPQHFSKDGLNTVAQLDPGTNLTMAIAPMTNINEDDTLSCALPNSPTQTINKSPRKAFSPIKYRLQDDRQPTNSPPGSPAEATIRFNEGLTRTINSLQNETQSEAQTRLQSPQDEGSVRIHRADHKTAPPTSRPTDDDIDITLSLGEQVTNDETFGDLSSISAIPTDLTRFGNISNSPSKTTPTEPWSPSKQLRNSVIFNTPGTSQRPLTLLANKRNSGSSNEEEEPTPRGRTASNESPVDLMNFTGQTNINIPPGSATRNFRRTPSGRGAFPVRVNPSPVHRSHASVDRDRAAGWSPQKQPTSYFPEQRVAATPASKRHSMYGAPAGLGMDLLDFDLEPMATPRSIPTVTPRELETLRSELQSRISGLEATLSGKEAEVMALKRAVTDAEVRVGKTSEDLRNERAARESMEHDREDMDRRTREMEEVLREVKQNAFVEEREREKLRRQAEEADRRAEECEVKILELNATLETLSSGKIRYTPSPDKSSDPSTPGMTADIDTAVKTATESVARELHALYKSKHERKVADLKLSYEKRWIKQVEQLKAELKTSQDEVAQLQSNKEAALNGVVPGQNEALSKMEGQIEELRRRNEEVNAEKKVLEAENTGLKGQLDSMLAETESVRKDIQRERVEKGELVAQIESYLTLKAEEDEVNAQRAQAAAQLQQPVSPPRSEDGNTGNVARPGSAAAAAPSPSKFRTSAGGGGEIGVPARTGRPRPMSMLIKPAAGKFSGIPAPGSGLKAPGSGNTGRGSVYGGLRSGIMENIARMGAGGRQ